MTETFFDVVIQACGIHSLFAPQALRSALQRAGLSPEALTAETLSEAQDHIEEAIRLYLGSDAEPFVEAVKALAG